MITRCILAGSLVGAIITPALAQEAAGGPGALYETCFVRTYDPTYLENNPGQRVAAISVYFQNFADTLLAGVSYRLRYGPKYGFSGDCHDAIDGGFSCEACASDSCDVNGESFKIFWPGGDSIQLVNDSTGVVAENADGGRDYLRAGNENRVFVMQRGTLADCAW